MFNLVEFEIRLTDRVHTHAMSPTEVSQQRRSAHGRAGLRNATKPKYIYARGAQRDDMFHNDKNECAEWTRTSKGTGRAKGDIKEAQAEDVVAFCI